MHFRYKDIIIYLLLFHFNTLQPKADAEKKYKKLESSILVASFLKIRFHHNCDLSCVNCVKQLLDEFTVISGMGVT